MQSRVQLRGGRSVNRDVTAEEYRSMAAFQFCVRRYLRFSEKTVRNADLEPSQYQLLLSIKGLAPNLRPTIAELAHRLQIQHHSAIELINRLEQKSLVSRERGTNDRREVLIRLTPAGDRMIAKLVALHMTELSSVAAPDFIKSLQTILRN